jgi:hypothetical protein
MRVLFLENISIIDMSGNIEKERNLVPGENGRSVSHVYTEDAVFTNMVCYDEKCVFRFCY